MSSKNKKVARSVVMQGGILALAGIICRIIGLFKKFPLQNIIGDLGVGYYSGAYEFYSIILILSSYSLPSAISKLIAQRQTRGQYKKMQKVFQGGLLFALISGGIFSLIVFIFADFFAGTVLKESMSTLSLRILAPTVFIVAVMAVFRGYFQGLGVMHFTATSQIVEQIVLVVVSLACAFGFYKYGAKISDLKMNPSIAASLGAAGATIGCGIGALAGLVVMIGFYLRNKNAIEKRVASDTSKNKDTMFDVFGLILKTAIPMIICSALYNITALVDQSIYNRYMINNGMEQLKSEIWGVYSGQYRVLISVPIALANAMVSAIIPSLSASIDNNDLVSARSKMSTVIRVTMIISIPAAFGLAVLGKPIVTTVFRSNYTGLSSAMLLYGSINVIFFSLSTLGSGILQGINKLIIPVFNCIVSLAIHILTMIFMLNVMHMGIHSVVIANILFSICLALLNHFAINRTINYKQELKQSFIIPIISSFIMAVFAFASSKILTLILGDGRKEGVIVIIVSVTISVIVYFIALIFLKGFNEYDLSLIPYGNRIYRILIKLGIYNEE